MTMPDQKPTLEYAEPPKRNLIFAMLVSPGWLPP
jgi:hypothetical protein